MLYMIPPSLNVHRSVANQIRIRVKATAAPVDIGGTFTYFSNNQLNKTISSKKLLTPITAVAPAININKPLMWIR
jgi:hypothetical protein